MAEKKKILFIDEAMGGGVNEENQNSSRGAGRWRR